MPRSDVLTLAGVFIGAGLMYLLSPASAWGMLIIGLALFCLYVAMGRFRIVVHYAGWGQGPKESMFLDVTEVAQSFIDSGRTDVKASTDFFGEHYVSPRMLKVTFSHGRWGEQKTKFFQEHDVMRFE